MTTPTAYEYLSHDGRRFTSRQESIEHERRWQLAQLGLSEQAIAEVMDHAAIIARHHYLIRSILLWRGTHGMPLFRRRGPRRKGAPRDER